MRLKYYLYQLVESLNDSIHVERFQRCFGLELLKNIVADNNKKKKSYRINNYFWYYLFSFGALLGYEVFYVLLYSYLYWNIDSYVCRNLMLIWALIMYVGQALKDIIRMPRPNGPNIVIMEPEYSFEYGMPSTHAMLAAMMPISLYALISNRYEFSLFIFIICSICWTTSICCSRIYLGMHSVLDILVGLKLTITLLVFILPMFHRLDYFLIRNDFSPLIIIGALVILSVIYPVSNQESPSRGDTISMISASGGVYIGSWINYRLSIINDYHSSHRLYTINWPSSYELSLALIRFIIGLTSLFLLRLFGKSISQCIIRTITGYKDLNQPPQKYLSIVQIPIKMFTFLMVGLAIAYFAPLLARISRIERQSMMFEAS